MGDNKDYSVYISYTEQANEITTKRQTMNSIYIAIDGALCALIGTFFGKVGIVLSIIGIILSFLWMLMLIEYKKLNSAKFEVIAKMEESLDIKPYTEEWSVAKKKKYFGITKIEIITSIIILSVFIILLIFSLVDVIK